MASSDRFRRYIEAGQSFGEINRARAEELVRDLVRTGELQRNQAQDWVEGLIERSRATTEAVVGMVRSEVRRQLKAMGLDNPEEVRKIVARLREQAERLPGIVAARRVAGPAVRSGADRPSAPRSPAKKTAAKKTAAKKTAAKKTAAKKTAATRAVTKQASHSSPRPGPSR